MQTFHLHTEMIPASWCAALGVIQTVADDAVIIGGALRDTFMCREVKDVDVFTHVRHHNILTDVLITAGWTRRGVCYAGYSQSAMADEVRIVQTWLVPGMRRPVQIVYLDVPDNRSTADFAVERVDFDACQISYDGDTLEATPAFLAAARSKLFSLVRCDTVEQVRRSMKRALSFGERHPHVRFDWTVARQKFPGVFDAEAA